MSDYRTMMRKKLLERIYDKMSPEEQKTFVQLTLQDKDHREIMQALEEIRQKEDDNHQSWLSDFSANVAGNYFADASIWLLSKLIRKL